MRKRKGLGRAAGLGMLLGGVELSRGGHGGGVQAGASGLTFRVQQTSQPQVLLCGAEGSLQVVVGVGLGEFAEVHEVRPRQAQRRQAADRSQGQGPNGQKDVPVRAPPRKEHNPAEGKAV